MAKASHAELLAAFGEMNSLELADFTRAFQDAFGVTLPAPAGPVPPDGPAEPEPPEQEEFDVVLENTGGNRIQVVKEVRSLLKLGLKEALAMADAAPVTILEQVDRTTADRARDRLAATGARVRVR
jgi:large subunit ribosomal protein L7/L12